MKKKRTFFKHVKAMLIVPLVIAAPSLTSAKETQQDGLKRCGLLEVVEQRLACYDKLSERQSVVPEKVIETATLPPDELGAESLRGKNKIRTKYLPVDVRITKCSESGRKNSNNIKYVFYLEGGQVWKQISDKRLHFKDCNFDASISKDFFGYKMKLMDSNRTLRVSRIR